MSKQRPDSHLNPAVEGVSALVKVWNRNLCTFSHSLIQWVFVGIEFRVMIFLQGREEFWTNPFIFLLMRD